MITFLHNFFQKIDSHPDDCGAIARPSKSHLLPRLEVRLTARLLDMIQDGFK